MVKRMLIEATHSEETRVAIVDDTRLVDFDYESASKKSIKGNVYLGKIIRVEPSLQAAFVDYGGNRHGFLAFSEIHPDYFRIPVEDREELEALRLKALAYEKEIEDNGEEERPSENNEKKEEAALLVVDSSAVPIAEEALALPADGIEVSPSLPAQESPKPRKTKKEDPARAYDALLRKYKIQEVIKSRQIVLVQVAKEERSNKGAALTTYISLAGRYCVLMPNAGSGGGISRKITDSVHRKRLKKLIEELSLPEGMALIVRTAGMDRSKTEIKRDFRYLISLWSEIRQSTLQAVAPSLVYEEADWVNRAIRDIYGRDIDEIHVEGEEAYKQAKEVIRKMVPSHSSRVQRYKSDTIPLFYKYGIERQINDIFQSNVRLKSGGYLVIHQTEALVAIDVNSGKSTRERHIDSTAYQTNLEAATEIARQIQLRDLSGLIVVDFIDMVENKQNIAVEKRLKEAMAMDRARTQFGRISHFGLLEMSRQRLRPSVFERSGRPCSYCQGTGMMRSPMSLGLHLLRILEEECALKKHEVLHLAVPTDVAFFLINEKRDTITTLEERYKFKLTLSPELTDPNGFCLKNAQDEVLISSTPDEDRPQRGEGKKDGRKGGGGREGRKDLHGKDRRHKDMPQSEDKTARGEPPAKAAHASVPSEARELKENKGERPRRDENEGGKKNYRRSRYKSRERQGNYQQNEGGHRSGHSARPKAEDSEDRAGASSPQDSAAIKPAKPEQAPGEKGPRVRPAENKKPQEKSPESDAMLAKRKGWWQRLIEP